MASEQNNTAVRWGIMGCARVAQRRWIPAIQHSRGGTVAALASRNLDKARQWARTFSAHRAYGSYEDLLADDTIDAVFIPLPNSLDRPWVIRSLQAGKHVLCDKPLGSSADDAAAMVAAAQRCNRLLMEGFMYQYHPQYQLIKQWLSENRLGRLHMLRAAFSLYFDTLTSDIRYDPALGGGALLDLGCYCVHMMRTLTGREPCRVRAVMQTLASGADGTTTALLEFDDDLTGIFDCSMVYQGDKFLHLAGEKGLITADFPLPASPATIVLHTTDETITETVGTADADAYADLLDDFHRRLRRREWLPCPARDSIANMRVLDAIHQSAQTGSAVKIACSG